MSPIPEDTRQAARQLYGLNQRYLVIGDQVKPKLEKLNWSDIDPFGTSPNGYPALLSLVSLFQYSEHLSDNQAATATGQRLDWKYALHLPLSYPGIPLNSLCTFRKQLASQPAGLKVFQDLIEKIEELGFFDDCSDARPEARDILEVNCLKHCLDRAISTMLPAIEVLASEQAAWLKQVALPHWYTRYLAMHDSLLQATTSTELITTIESVGKDMVYLIQAIRNQPEMKIETYPEVQELLEAQNMFYDFSVDQNCTPGSGMQLYLLCNTCVLRQSMDTPSI